MKLHRDEAQVTDLYFAAFLAYAGYEVMKCMVTGRDTTWVFLVPSCDLDIMRKEFDEDREVQSRSFTASIKQVICFQSTARSNSGEFITPAWRRVIGI